ncbi:hypothetical protein, partial [Polaromonas sp. 35-63-35]
MAIIIISYSILIVINGDNSFSIPYTHIIFFLEVFFIPLFIFSYWKKIFKEYSWEIPVVLTGLVAGVISTFLILNPDLNSAIRLDVIYDSLDTRVSSGNNYVDYRGFSIAEGSTYSYGVTQGIIAGICILLMGSKSYYYIFPAIPIFLSVIFNARIGIVAISTAFFLAMINFRFTWRTFFSIGFLILVALFVFFYFSSIVENLALPLIWSLSILEELSRFILTGDRQTTFGLLFDDFIFFPDGAFGMIFGTGEDVFNGSYRNSDIGYIRSLFQGGIIYIFLKMLMLTFIFMRCFRKSMNKFYPILFLVTILAANYKGQTLFYSTGFFRLFIMYYIYVLFFDSIIFADKGKFFRRKILL